MRSSQKKALSSYRRRSRRKGIIRLEVNVRAQVAALVRSVVDALADPKHDEEARALLRALFAAPKVQGLKDILAAAPLEGIELERIRDVDRLC